MNFQLSIFNYQSISYLILSAIIVFFLGASVGSFVAASVYRMKNKKSILRGRSECEKCGKKLAWYELIPIFSYICLRGKCGKCGKKIGAELLLTEAICGALYVAAYFYHRSPILFLLLIRDWIFLSGLVFLFIYDLKYKILPDAITITVAAAIFIVNIILGYKITDLVLAVAVGGGFFAAQYLVSRGKWIGAGDIRMGALLGAALGWPAVMVAIFISYIFGGFYGGYLLLRKRAVLKTQIAFGTFLAVGGVVGLYWGDYIIKWYLGY